MAVVATLGTIGTVVGAASAIGGAASALFGGGGGGGAAAASESSLRKAREQFRNLETPEIKDLRVRLQKAVFTGAMQPIQAIAMMQRASEMTGVKADPRAEFQQYQALENLSRSIAEGGATREDKEQLFSSLAGQGVDVAGARGRLEQGLAERGLLDQSAQELQRAVAGQAGANRAAGATMQAAADAESRSEAALQARGVLAGNIRAQSFDEQSRRAAAQDAINLANAAMANKFAQDRAANLRDVRDYRMNTRQGLSDLNVGIANKQAQENIAALQKDYENRLRKAQGLASAYGASSGVSSQRSGSSLLGGIGAVGQLASAASKFIK